MSTQQQPFSLLDLLSNEYLLLSITPFLLPTELLALSSTSHHFHELLTHSRSVWRHLNLSLSPHPPHPAALATKPHTPLYQTSAHTLLSRPPILRDTKTLILDGLPITTELLSDLLATDKYKLQLLSIRECPNLNQRHFIQLLTYLCRPSRAANHPVLKGCYWFGEMDAPGGIFPNVTRKKEHMHWGRFVKEAAKLADAYVGMLVAAKGVVAFDAGLCAGRRHEGREQAIASVRVRGGCAECGEGEDAGEGVLMPPVPVLTSDVRVACRRGGLEKAVVRCEGCVKHRVCERCWKWWCEKCVEKGDKKRVQLDCYECGSTCKECAEEVSRSCRSCRGGYCIIHNEGADNVWCEWCKSPERRLRESPIQPVMRVPTFTPMTTTQQQRARTLARLNALRASLGFQDERVIARRTRCMVASSCT